MAKRIIKKNLIVSLKNLPDDVLKLLKEAYPDGYADYVQKQTKPNGEPLYVVPLDTPDVYYMIKVDVKVDSGLVEADLDKDLYGSEEKEDDGEFAPISEAIDKEEGESNSVGTLKHGSYEDMMDDMTKVKKSGVLNKDDFKELFEDGDEDEDEYQDDKPEEDDEEEFDGPSDEDLLEIEKEFHIDIPEVETDKPQEESKPKKRGRKPSAEKAAAKAEKAAAKAEKAAKTAKTKTPKAPKEPKAPKTPKTPKPKK